MIDVSTSEPIGDEDFDRVSEEFRAPIAEDPFRLRVDQDDVAALVDDDNSVRRRFQEPPELRFRFLTVADVPDRAHGERAVFRLERTQTDLDGKFRAIALHPGG